MLSDLIQLNIFAFFMIFARVGSVFMLMPGIGSGYVPMNIRLAIALAVCFIVTPFLAAVIPGIPGSEIELMLLLFSEIVIGVFIGLIGRITVGALQTAGTLIALFWREHTPFCTLVDDVVFQNQSTVLTNDFASSFIAS